MNISQHREVVRVKEAKGNITFKLPILVCLRAYHTTVESSDIDLALYGLDVLPPLLIEARKDRPVIARYSRRVSS